MAPLLTVALVGFPFFLGLVMGHLESAWAVPLIFFSADDAAVSFTMLESAFGS